jgi:sulfite dehydrogenase
MIHRRQFLQSAGIAGLSLGLAREAASADRSITLPFENGERTLAAFPQKRPLILLTSRPPQLETPFSVFNDGPITPNDAFFVRYHLSGLPTDLDPDTFRIEVKGRVKTPLAISLDGLKTDFEPIEFVAVNQCSGNSRGFFSPRVAGGQLGNGAMGNARWTGVPLKAILDKAGLLGDARQVVFNGMDVPAVSETPDFLKALDIDHARDGEVMLAYRMNGEDLPFLNGYPVRLIVPGFYGTYWVKHLNEITVVDKIFDGFWMKTAYRIPANDCACVAAGGKVEATVPINRFNPRSFITNLGDGGHVKAGTEIAIKGIAFDGGYGITDVTLSADGGKNWVGAELGKDLGKYSFREWSGMLRLGAGTHEVSVRAHNRIGQSQPLQPLWNPAGYMRNAVETIRLTAA